LDKAEQALFESGYVGGLSQWERMRLAQELKAAAEAGPIVRGRNVEILFQFLRSYTPRVTEDMEDR